QPGANHLGRVDVHGEPGLLNRWPCRQGALPKDKPACLRPIGALPSAASVMVQGHPMTDDTSPSPGSDSAQETQFEEAPAVPTKATSSPRPPWKSEAWGQVARGASLFVLLGMGFA